MQRCIFYSNNFDVAKAKATFPIPSVLSVFFLLLNERFYAKYPFRRSKLLQPIPKKNCAWKEHHNTIEKEGEIQVASVWISISNKNNGTKRNACIGNTA
jgi:hypothetical protein